MGFERVRAEFGRVIVLDEAARRARLAVLLDTEPDLYEAVRTLVDESDLATREGFLEPEAHAGMDAAVVTEGEAAPERIGRYRVIGTLGSGATGVVYRGVADAPMRREAAIKVVRAAAPGSASQRFDQEIRALASLNHPSIAGVFESGVLNDGRRWAACELVEGTPVTEACRARSLGWEARVGLVIQAAEGLHHAHGRGVVHRDLKPSNVLACPGEDGSLAAKVIDFGVARLSGPRAPGVYDTEPGLVVGTLAYMAPEQLRGGPADARTDVYALGLLLYELIAGKPARGSGAGLGSIAAASERPVTLGPSGCAGRGRDVGAVIACATDPDPGVRYPSAKHFAEDLERLLDGRPVVARRPSAAYRLWLYARRSPGVAVGVVLALALVVSLGAGLAASRARLSVESRDQRGLLTGLIHETLDDLSTISGTADSRVRMVGLLSDRVDRLLAMHPGDAELLSVKARLLRERGDLHHDAGRYAEALDALRASSALYEGLHRGDPSGTGIGRLYAESLVRVGDVLLETDGLTGEVQALYTAAMGIQERLIDLDPADLTLRDDYCWSYDRLAQFFDIDSDRAALEAWHTERLRLSLALYEEDPDRVLSRLNLGKAYLNLGRLNQRTGRPEVAIEQLRRSHDLFVGIVRASPERGLFLHYYIFVMRHLMETEAELGIDESREERAQELVAQARGHAARNAGNLRAEILLVRVLTLAAEWHESWGEPEKARAYAEECLSLIGSIRARGVDPRLGIVSNEAYARRMLERLGPGGAAP